MTDLDQPPEMASFWQRIKFMYLGRKSIARFALPLLLLTIIVLILRWATSPVGTVLHEDNVFRFRHIDEDDIHAHLLNLPDTRAPACIKTPYTGSHKEKVSIILDFSEQQFLDLRMTLESILMYTPHDHFSEIVLLDDGSGDAALQSHAARYLSDTRFSMVKAYRSEKSDGPALSRFKASKVASGSILIFLTSDVVVTRGWIDPLIDHVQKNRHSIAVPHVDNILSGFRHFKTPENVINVMSLPMTTLFYETQQKASILNTPVMTGAVFAVDKKYLDDLGNIDDGMVKGGGENLELSLRAWMCGGSVQINTCSRVAVRDAFKPVEVTEKRNFQRISELWLGPLKQSAYRQRGHSFNPNENDRMSLRMRKAYLQKRTKCGTIDDYLSKVAPMVLLPPKDSKFFGKLRAGTGYCLTRMPEAGQMMKMVHCRPHLYEPDSFFGLDHLGRLSRASKCVELIFNGDVHFTNCELKKADQLWEFLKDGRLQSAFKTTKCLTHHFDPEKNSNYLAAADCDASDRGQIWKFVKY